MRFKPGQEITPKQNKWEIIFGGPIPVGQTPKFGHVYTVELYPFRASHPKEKYLLLTEINTALFNEDSFEPLVTTQRLEDDLMEKEFDLKTINQLIDG